MAIPCDQSEQQIISRVIVEDVAEEIILDRNKDIERLSPQILHDYTLAVSERIHPVLDQLVRAYRQACAVPYGREAAILFLSNMLEAED